MQKAREGKWNGGFAPYGYALIDGKLVVNEEEAVAIRTIFDQYVNTDLGAISDGVNVSVVLDCGFGNTSKRK